MQDPMFFMHRGRVQRLCADTVTIIDENANLKNEMEELKQELDRNRDAKEFHASRVQVLLKIVEEKNAEIEEKNAIFSKLSCLCHELIADNEKLKADLESTKIICNQTNRGYSALQANINRLEFELAIAEDRAVRLALDMTAINPVDNKLRQEIDRLERELEEYRPIDWCLKEGVSALPKAFSLKDANGQTLQEYIDTLKEQRSSAKDAEAIAMGRLAAFKGRADYYKTKYEELVNSCGVVFPDKNTPVDVDVLNPLYQFNNSTDMAFAIMQFHRELKETKEKLRVAEQDIRSWKDHFYYQSKQ